MKAYFAKLGTYALDFVAAILIGMLALFLIYPIELVCELTTFSERLVCACLSTVTSTLWLFFAARREGYKNKEFKLSCIIPSILTIFIIQLALSPLFDYANYIAGSVNYLTWAIYLVEEPLYAVTDVPHWVYLLLMGALDAVIYLPAIIAGEYLGAKKRQKERDSLLGHKEV